MKLKKKTVSRRRSKNPSKKKLYFGKEVHLAIIDYQNCESREQKHVVYAEKIKGSFEKLVETLLKNF